MSTSSREGKMQRSNEYFAGLFDGEGTFKLQQLQ